VTGAASATARQPWLRSLCLSALLAIGAVLLLQVIYAAALIGVGAHTDLAAARAHIREAFADGVIAWDRDPRWFFNRGGHDFTECQAWNITLDDGRSAADIAFLPGLHFDTEGPCESLTKTAAALPSTKFWSYQRYWHGYRLYTWPMIQWFSLQTVRIVNALLILGALIWLYREFRAAIGHVAAPVFFLVLMSLSDIWRLWVNTPHAVAMVVILAGAALFAGVYRRWPDSRSAILLAAVLGSVFNFVDFLSTPPMAPLLLAFIVLAWGEVRDTSANIARRLFRAALVAASWFGGYALTWLAKWVLAILISPDSHAALADILGQIELRTYGEDSPGDLSFMPLLPTTLMIIQCFISVGSITVAILFAAIVRHLLRNWSDFDWRKFFVLAAPVLITTLWFEVLSNHTQTHSHFTYRSQAAAIAVVFAAAVLSIKAPPGLAQLVGDLWHDLRRVRARPRADAAASGSGGRGRTS